jgi:hypothetical protein
MTVQTSGGSVSIGRDAQLIIQTANGVVDAGHILNFTYKRVDNEIDFKRMDGVRMLAKIPNGAEGSFEAARNGPELEKFFSAEAALWKASGVLQVSTLYFYVTETGGVRTVYEFTGCAVTLDDGGTWEGEKNVNLKVSFKAADLVVS